MSASKGMRVTGTADGLVRVWVPDTTRESRQAARKLAAGEAHTLVGAAQDLGASKGGHILAFAPIARRQAGEAAKPEPAWNPGELLTLALQGDPVSAERLVALLTGAKPAKAPKAPREVPEFIAKARAVTCHTCRDLGVVRGVGANAGKPYRTADGAKAAKAAGRTAKCPSHKRAATAA